MITSIIFLFYFKLYNAPSLVITGCNFTVNTNFSDSLVIQFNISNIIVVEAIIILAANFITFGAKSEGLSSISSKLWTMLLFRNAGHVFYTTSSFA